MGSHHHDHGTRTILTVRFAEGQAGRMATPPEAGEGAAVWAVWKRTARSHGRVQLPLALGVDSEPEPDLAVVEGSARSHLDAHPTTAALVLEVADTSLGIVTAADPQCWPASRAVTRAFRSR